MVGDRNGDGTEPASPQVFDARASEKFQHKKAKKRISAVSKPTRESEYGVAPPEAVSAGSGGWYFQIYHGYIRSPRPLKGRKIRIIRRPPARFSGTPDRTPAQYGLISELLYVRVPF
jgi:hypothetical protein